MKRPTKQARALPKARQPVRPAKPVKARLMWTGNEAPWQKCPVVVISGKSIHPEMTNVPVFVLPADRASVERMREQVARAIYVNERRYESVKLTWETTFKQVRAAYLKDADAATNALGLASPHTSGEQK